MARTAIHTPFLITLTIIVACSAVAQVDTGVPPFSSTIGGSFDTVNLGNLNVHFAVPVVHKAGRGTPFTYDLGYDSSIWYPATVNGVLTWTPVFNWGWTAETAVNTGYISFDKFTQVCDWPPPKYGTYTIWSRYVYHDASGGSHSFVGTLEQDSTNCDNGNISSLTGC